MLASDLVAECSPLPTTGFDQRQETNQLTDAAAHQPSPGFLGAINFPQGSLFASSCAAVSEHSTILAAPRIASRYSLHGKLGLLYRVRRRNAVERLFARRLSGVRAPTSVSAASIRLSRRRPCLAKLSCPRPRTSPRVRDSMSHFSPS
jgi:hypothetical protein